jgi:hypothetical protein
MESTLFPSAGMRVFSATIHFVGTSFSGCLLTRTVTDRMCSGLTLVTHCLSRRMSAESLFSIDGLRQFTFARVLILLVLIDSWLFVFTSASQRIILGT